MCSWVFISLLIHALRAARGFIATKEKAEYGPTSTGHRQDAPQIQVRLAPAAIGLARHSLEEVPALRCVILVRLLVASPGSHPSPPRPCLRLILATKAVSRYRYR